MNKTVVIVGPTSSGKTSLALNIVNSIDARIISADSRQVIKEMDVGTGKLPLNREQSVSKRESCWIVDGKEIWGYDIAEVNQRFSVYDYAIWYKRQLEKFKGLNILVGGTGLYIDIVTSRQILELYEPNEKLKSELEKMKLEELGEVAKSKGIVLNESDIKNKVRIINSIARYENKTEQNSILELPKMETLYLGLNGTRAHLYQRADFWLEKIWNDGLMDETQKLMKKYPDSPKLQGLIYKSAIQNIQNPKEEPNHRQKAKYDLHSYIRRQQTWFKRNKEILWFDIQDRNLEESIIKAIDSFLIA